MGIALHMYTGDNNNIMPLLKWDPTGSIWYPYEMARFTTPDFTAGMSMGWEDLGLLYSTKLISDARIFYCPSNPKANTSQYSYDYYVSGNYPTWPFGMFQNGPLINEPNTYVRCGYSYFPQNQQLDAPVQIPGPASIGSVALPTVNNQNKSSAMSPPATTAISSWHILTSYSEDALNPAKAVAADNMASISNIFHVNGHGQIAGLNALSADGHVTWQSAEANPILFDASSSGVWSAIDNNSQGTAQTDIRYLMYSWQ
jgi:hypothetical protein